MKLTVLLTTAAVAALALAACQKKEAAPEAAAPAAADAGNVASATVPETPAAGSPAEDAAAGVIDNPAPAAAPAAAAAAAPSSTGAPPTATSANANGTESTESFITGVTLSDMYQIQAGKIAEAKGQSQGVKDYGAKMVTDHTAMSNQMRHLFSATSTPIPTELGPRGKRMIDDLNAAAAADFDKLYLAQQQTTQAAELALLSAYAEGGESKDIKPAAARAVPKVQAHLAKVNELQAAPQ
jgi:putative membrane protein